MNRIPPEIAIKIVSSDTLSTKDVRNLTRTNQLLRYAALPKICRHLEISVEAENFGQQIGIGNPRQRLECFMLELPHLHVCVERVVVRLWGSLSPLRKELVQTSLTRVLHILADLLPLLSSLREFHWQEEGLVTLGQEAGAAMLSVLTALLRSPVTTLTIYGALLPFLAQPPLANPILQSRVERVKLFFDFEDGAVDQIAALSHAPKLTSLDIMFRDRVAGRGGIEPATESAVVADGFWCRLRHLSLNVYSKFPSESGPHSVWTFILGSAESFKTERSDGGGLVLRELSLKPPRSSQLNGSITSLSTRNLSSLRLRVDFASLGEDTIGLIGSSFPNLTRLALILKKTGRRSDDTDGHSVNTWRKALPDAITFRGSLRSLSRDDEQCRIIYPGLYPQEALKCALSKTSGWTRVDRSRSRGRVCH